METTFEGFDWLAGWILKIAKDLLGFLAMPLLGWLVWREMRRSPVIFDPFAVPKKFEEEGLSGEVFAHRVRDAMLRIQKETKTLAKRSNVAAARDEGSLPDLDIAGTKMGIKSITDILRDLLGLHLRHVSGDIVLRANPEDSSGCTPSAPHAIVTLYLTRGRERDKAIEIQVPRGDRLELIQKTAEAVLDRVDPYILGMHQKDLGQYDAALMTARRMLDRVASNSTSFASPGRTFRTLRYRGVFTLEKERAVAYNLKGNVLLDQRQYDEAIACYAQAVAIDPAFASVYNNWGEALADQGKFDDAVELYQRAIHFNSKFVEAYNNWGNALCAQRLYEDAIAKYQKAIDIDPRFEVAYSNWGLALFEQQLYDDAIEKYRRALDIDPHYAKAYSGWANALYEQQKYAEAIAVYEAAIKSDPLFAFAYINQGNALCALARFDEAIEKYRKAIELDPTLRKAFYNLGVALGKLGMETEAVEMLRRAQEISAAP